jgi:hypothetical protein
MDSAREQVILPWKKTIRISETTTVILTAPNPSQKIGNLPVTAGESWWWRWMG